MAEARYDGYADWYDETFRQYGDKDGSAGLLASLLGPAEPSDPLCLDLGCGGGLHFGAVRSLGYTVVGVDLSADQLRIARTRCRSVVRADAGRLPLPAASVGAVVMTFTHTDVDDFPAVVEEAARVLRPRGRLVYVGLHPTYLGPFVDRSAEVPLRSLRFAPGYGDDALRFDSSGPIRSRVGARNLTLTTFLRAFLAQDRLRLDTVGEYDTNFRPWQLDASDGRIVPWNVAVTARVRHE